MSPAPASTDPLPAGRRASRGGGRRVWRWIRRALLALVVLVLLFVGLLLWLGTDSARDIVLGQAVRLAAGSGIELSVEGASGNFRRGVQAERVRMVNGQQVIEIDELKTAWSLWPLSGGQLQVAELRAGQVRVTLPPGAPATQAEPVTLPDLALPIEVHVDALSIGRLELRTLSDASSPAKPDDAATAADEPLVITGLSLAAHLAKGRATVQGLALGTRWGDVTDGRLEAGLESPHPIKLAAAFAGEPAAGIPVRLTLRAEGLADEFRAVLRGQVAGAVLDGRADLRVLDPVPSVRADVQVEKLDLSRLRADLPATDIELTARIGNRESAGGVLPGTPLPVSVDWQGRLDLTNVPGRLHEGRVPLRSLATDLSFHQASDPAQHSLRLSRLRIELPGTQAPGEVRGDLRVGLGDALTMVGIQVPPTVAGLMLTDIDLAQFGADLPPTRLGGTVDLSNSLVQVSLQQPPGLAPVEGLAPLAKAASLTLQASVGEEAVDLASLQVSLADSRIGATGRIGLLDTMPLTLSGNVQNLRPTRFLKPGSLPDERWRDTLINAGFAVQGALKPSIDASLTLNLVDSRAGGGALAGLVKGQVAMAPDAVPARVDEVLVDLRYGRNRVNASGALGQADDVLTFNLALEEPGLLAPALAGRLEGKGRLTGPFERLEARLEAQGRGLQWQAGEQAYRLARLDVQAALPLITQFSARDAFDLKLRARRIEAAGQTVDNLTLDLGGRVGEHTLAAMVQTRGQRLDLTAAGALAVDALQWDGALTELRVSGDLPVRLTRRAELSVSAKQASLGGLRLALAEGTLQLDRLQAAYGQAPSGALAGRISGVRVARLAALVGDRALPAGLEKLRLDSSFSLEGSSAQDLNARLQATMQAPAGQREGLAAVRNEADLRVDAGRLGGTVSVALPSLRFTRQFIGPEWQLDGRLDLSGELAGTVLEPTWRGTARGSGLSLLQPLMGWRMDQGQLLVRVDGRSLALEKFTLNSPGEGDVSLTGSAQMLEPGVSVAAGALPLDGQFNLVTRRLAVPIGPGQRVVVSGESVFRSTAQGARLSGQMQVDEGLIEIGASGVPGLPDDVVVTDEPSRAPPPSAAPAKGGEGVAVVSDLSIDLGNSLRVVGSGVDATLAGALNLGGRLPQSPSITGTVRIPKGSYTAYSQNLQIQRGNVVFNGPADNPNLDIYAVRPRLPVEVGVAVSGTALSPRIELLSTPAMNDAEKLSWLVLGTPLSDAAGAAQSLALKEAAMSLIGQDDGSISGGGMADKLGLDNIGLGYASETGQQQTVRDSGAPTGLPGAQGNSSSTVREEVVALSKRLGDKVLVSYEQGVRGVWNLLRIQYEISQRLSVRAQTGSESAVDLLYFYSFD